MKIAIIPNHEKLGARETATEVIKRLKANGAEVYVSDKGYDAAFAKAAELYELCDIIITVGGDGTIISHAKDAAVHKKPVLGINAGRLGFLADLEKNDLSLLERLVSGDYTVCNRFMLKATVYSGNEKIAEGLALNDAVIAPGGIARLLDLEVEISGDTIGYRSDGIIISTPTGSTAYSMSAGGPIIDPLTESFCITPICSHSLSAKPILLGADNEIKVKAFSKKRTDIYLTVDGRKVAAMKPYTEIYIKKSEQTAQLIRLNNRSFYKTLSYKFKDSRSV